MEPRIDVHLLTLNEPAEWREACIASLEDAPIQLHVLPGVPGRIGEARAAGYAQGTLPLVSFVDPDDLYEASAFTQLADALDAVARSLPGLWRAEKIQKKAAEAGFDWRDVSDALDKLDEETAELRQAVRGGPNVEEELGDVLFAAVKVGRFCGVDPETAVNGTCEKFIRRFRAMEEAAAAEGRSLSDMTLEEMTALWNGAKECS